MGILDKKARGDACHIVGATQDGQPTYYADVEWIDGKPRLLTSGIVQIEELFGQDNQADTWFYLGTQYDVGPISAGDTVRIQIAAGPNASLFPAIDKTYTVTPADVAAPNPEVAVANGIVSMLNGDATFKAQWKAQRITDNSTVWIGSKMVGEWSERPNTNDFQVSKTGTIGVIAAFDKIVRRGKSTSLTKDPNDPRFGVLGITGTVAQSVQEIGQIYIKTLEQSPEGSGLYALNVDGSVTPQVFWVFAQTDKDIYVQELRWYAVTASVKFQQFLSISSALTNGVKIEIKADDSYILGPLYKTTEDLKNKFAIGGTWSLEAQPSTTSTIAVFRLGTPIPIRHVGEFTTDDYIKVTIQDNLSSLGYMEMLAFGFTRDI